ncbi:MAG: hypothetical protein HWN81_21420 [Candidatus Lokiarchaeota archaeon]|nr:hypothetical protein [Candidatus Lokiarchaeota archaeon]
MANKYLFSKYALIGENLDLKQDVKLIFLSISKKDNKELIIAHIII